MLWGIQNRILEQYFVNIVKILFVTFILLGIESKIHPSFQELKQNVKVLAIKVIILQKQQENFIKS